jgi:general secretion pathway protein H
MSDVVSKVRSGTGRSTRRPAPGFTLIELLVVLVILGVLSSLVALTSAPDPRRAAADDATRLQLVLELALQEAQTSGRPIAWVAEGRGYRFMQADLERRWQAITGDDSLRPRLLAEGMRVDAISVEGQALAPDAWLVFASTTTPLFRIELGSAQGVYVLSARPDGRVDLTPPGAS